MERSNLDRMTEHEASRTLVKSPPELWAECSDAGALARHLGQFGVIRITGLEPETAVAWEGELVSGTVRLEPSGWGTKVVLTARAAGEAPETGAGEAPETPAIEVPQTPAVEAPETGAVEVQADPELEPASMAAEQAAIEPEPVVREPVEPEPVVREPVVREPPPVPLARPARRPGLLARLRAWFAAPEPAREPVAPAPAPGMATREPEPEPAVVEPEPAVVEPKPAVPESEPAVVEPPASQDELDTVAALAAALDSLGQAHHRPFSRA